MNSDILDDPWQKKTGRLVAIIFLFSVLFIVFGVYDGTYFYSRYAELCSRDPGMVVCKNFKSDTVANAGPTLNQLSDQGSGNFAIQIGSYNSESNAGKATQKLNSEGVQTRLKKFKVKGKFFYRVQLGRFREQKNASSMGELLKQKGLIQEFLVVKYDSSK